MTKIYITMEGGNISSIASSRPIKIVINDYDNDEENQISEFEPDEIFTDGEAHKLIKADERWPLSNQEQLAKAFLKEIGY